MNTNETRKAIRKQLKTEFPNCKFSVVGKSASMCLETVISLTVAPFEVFGAGDDADCTRYTEHARESGYAQLNHYQLDKSLSPSGRISNGVYLTPQAWRIMKRAFEIALLSEKYDGRMFFFSMAIGKAYDRPFRIIVRE